MLKVRVQQAGHVVVLYLRGQMVIGETNNLLRSVTDISDARVLVLDIARVSRIDAHGLGVLLKLRQQLYAKGIALRLMNVTKLVQQVLRITKLDGVFEVTDENHSAATKPKDVNKKPATKREDSGQFVWASYD